MDCSRSSVRVCIQFCRTALNLKWVFARRSNNDLVTLQCLLLLSLERSCCLLRCSLCALLPHYWLAFTLGAPANAASFGLNQPWRGMIAIGQVERSSKTSLAVVLKEKGESMKTCSRYISGMLFVLLTFMPSMVQATPRTLQEDTSAKQDVKDAGHSTKRAVKKTGSATKKESKQVVSKSAKKTKEGADKVEDKTEPQH